MVNRVLALMLVALVMLAGTARAADADARVDRFSSLTVLELEPSLFRLVEEPVTYREGPVEVTVQDGVMVPVFSGRFAGAWERDARAFLREQREAGRPDRVPSPTDRGTRAFVGFVLVGATARIEVELDDRADAQVLANRLVRLGIEEPDAVRAIAEQGRLITSVDEALFLGTDPRLERLYIGPAYGDPDNPDSDLYSVVVYGEREGLGRDLSRAERLFRQRMDLYGDLGMEVPEMLALDRYDSVPWADSSSHFLLADLHTGQRYGHVAPMVRGRAGQDRWLALMRHDQGYLDSRRQWTVASLGIASNGWPVRGKVGGRTLPARIAADPTSAPRPPTRVEPVKADVRVLGTPRKQGTLAVDVVAELTVRATGAPVRALRIGVPWIEAEPDTWQLVDVVDLEGNSLVGSSPVLDRRIVQRRREREDQQDGDQGTEDPEDPEEDGKPLIRPDEQLPTVRVWVFLPQELQPGQTATFQVRYKDTWNLRTWAPCFGERPMGESTGLMFPVPQLPWAETGDPWPVTLRVGVPASSGLRVAASGVTTSQEERKGWRLLKARSDGPARYAGVAVGRWGGLVDAPVDTLPGVRANLFSTSAPRLRSVGQQVRQIALYYRGWLPDFPVRELDVFEAPKACGGFTWIAPHGMVQLQAMVVRDDVSGRVGALNDRWFEESTLAHEVAHQYWGHLVSPASLEDFWIAETLAEGFACMYVGKLTEGRACESRMRAYRRRWEKDLPDAPSLRASLSEAYYSGPLQPSIVYSYGPYVLHEMLRRKIGTQAYFQALDGVARLEGPLTTERLQAAMELASDQQLDDFFDFWVHNGFIPKVALTWWLDESGRVAGRVTSDVPFGSFEVPVVIEHGEQRDEVWVTVVDGVGTLTGPVVTDRARVDLDPEGRVIARSRRVRKGEPEGG